MKIEANRLRQLRSRKGWSQKQLARRVGVNEQTIYKAEKAGWPNPRPQTLARLTQEFAVSVEVLAGAVSLPPALTGEEEGHDPDFETLRYRVSPETRNAYSLVARRYQVPERMIANLAPVLFAITAEQSLRRRSDLLHEWEKRLQAAHDAASRLPHLGSSEDPDWTDDDEVMVFEGLSIDQRDILGEITDGAAADRHFPKDPEDGGFVADPFTAFIRDCAKSVGLVAYRRHLDDEPVGIALPDEIKLIAGDNPDLAAALSSGSILVRDVPADLLKPERQAERIAWLRDRLPPNEYAREEKRRSHKLLKTPDDLHAREPEEGAPDA
jgi:transcriptional regulator with XRE-family HTH domain